MDENQKEDGTHCGGLYFEGVVGAALHTFNSTRLEEKPERRWYTLWWTLLRRRCWSRFAYIQHNKATLQFGYLLRNDAEYDFGRKGNTIDWPAHTCAELETALKLIQSYPELKGMLDASLAWADPKN